MIIWINGAFGAGKTSVARRLVERLEGASILDPETIGLVLQRLPWLAGGADFQDLPSWRRWTVRATRMAAKVRRPLIVPMTLTNRDYFEEIVEQLRQHASVLHFTLLASPDVLRGRLRARGASAWGEEQIARCTEALGDPTFAHHVPTDDRSIEDIVEEIVGRSSAAIAAG